MHQRFPKLHFLQLTTMDDFVEWLYMNHRQNLIAKVKPPQTHKPEQVVIEETDDRVKALMGCGVSREQSVALLEHYGSIAVLLQKKTRQKEMVKVSGITHKQAKRILSLRKDFINKA